MAKFNPDSEQDPTYHEIKWYEHEFQRKKKKINHGVANLSFFRKRMGREFESIGLLFMSNTRTKPRQTIESAKIIMLCSSCAAARIQWKKHYARAPMPRAWEKDTRTAFFTLLSDNTPVIDILYVQELWSYVLPVQLLFPHGDARRANLRAQEQKWWWTKDSDEEINSR